MVTVEFSQIAETLRFLQSSCPDVFGADLHGFRLNPPLHSDEVLAFERKHSIRLPDDFREFVTRIGNGGAGPFYGVFPLGVVDDNDALRDWHEKDDLVGIPAEPFPFKEKWNDVSNMPSAELLDRDEAEYWSRMEAFEKVYWSSEQMNGAMPICHEGCALRVLLVLTGPQAGTLWRDLRSEYGGLTPLKLADGSSADFSRWYGKWLEECLSVAESRMTGDPKADSLRE